MQGAEWQDHQFSFITWGETDKNMAEEFQNDMQKSLFLKKKMFIV